MGVTSQNDALSVRIYHSHFYDSKSEAIASLVAYLTAFAIICVLFVHAYLQFYYHKKRSSVIDDPTPIARTKAMTMFVLASSLFYLLLQSLMKVLTLLFDVHDVTLCIISEFSITFVFLERFFLYALFLYRLYVTFEGTVFEYSKKCLLTYLLVFMCLGVICCTYFEIIVIHSVLSHYRRKASCHDPNLDRSVPFLPVMIVDFLIALSLLCMFLHRFFELYESNNERRSLSAQQDTQRTSSQNSGAAISSRHCANVSHTNTSTHSELTVSHNTDALPTARPSHMSMNAPSLNTIRTMTALNDMNRQILDVIAKLTVLILVAVVVSWITFGIGALTDTNAFGMSGGIVINSICCLYILKNYHKYYMVTCYPCNFVCFKCCHVLGTSHIPGVIRAMSRSHVTRPTPQHELVADDIPHSIPNTDSTRQ